MRDKRSFLIVLDLLPAADDFSLALVLLFFKQRVSKVLAYGSNFFAEDCSRLEWPRLDRKPTTLQTILARPTRFCTLQISNFVCSNGKSS